jgi:hypothetical protein
MELTGLPSTRTSARCRLSRAHRVRSSRRLSARDRPWRALEEAERLAVLPPGVQGGQGHTRLHQHSSSKPTAHSGFAPAISISRSRLLFSFLQWLRRGDPALGPHPHRTERRRDKVARMVSPETRSGLNRSSKATSRRPSPKSTSCSRARIPSESGGASPSKPRRLPPREGGLHALGAREGGREGFEAALVDEEGADGVPHPLRSAPEVLGDLRRRVPAGARQKDLAPAHPESVSRAQSGFEALTLVFRPFRFISFTCSFPRPPLCPCTSSAATLGLALVG